LSLQRDHFGIAVSVEADQVFGLLLQIGKIRPLGQFISLEIPVHQIAVDRKTGCAKRQMLFDRCKWVRPLPPARARLAPQK
jgi:hypothetical protein